MSIAIKKGFTLASLIYFFNSVGNVAQGVFIKYFQANLNIGTYELITLKCIVSVVILLPFVLKYIDKNIIKNLPIIALLAFLYSADMLLYNTGLKTVAVNTGALIMLLVPLWIVVLGRIILKEKKFNIVNAFALLACLVAVFLTIKSDISFGGFNVGYILLLINSLVVPLGLILQKKFSDTRPVMLALFSNAVFLGLLSFTMSGFNIPEFSIQNLKGAFIVALFDIMECACVYIAYKMTDCALLQPIRFTRIFIAIFLSYILLNEKITSMQIIATTIIVMANMASILYSRKKQD